MRFFLTGIETNNKGAELMLYAILQEIERVHPEAEIFVESNRLPQGVTYIKSDLKIHLLENSVGKLVNLFHINSLLRLFHLKQIEHWPNIPNVDYIIDGSGLLFVDDMVDQRSYNYWSYIFTASKFSKKVFLPQSFGPLNKQITKDAVKLLFQNANLIFARDPESYKYLMGCDFVDKKKLNISSDFTSLVKTSCPSHLMHLRGKICVIPNMQMVNKGGFSLDEYIDYIDFVVKECKKTGKEVFLLNHQGQSDDSIINIYRNRKNKEIECISGLNALDTKGVISVAYAVITSRFHGLASALNSCVPSLATSWSHKYQTLFEDFGITDGVLNMKDIEKDRYKIQQLLDAENNIIVRNKLENIKADIQNQTHRMWETVWSV